MKNFLLISLFILIPMGLSAQSDHSSDLYATLKSKDSLLFNVGYNTCYIQAFEELISDDFEFYHDRGGITGSKEAFIDGIKNGLCTMNYKPRRELDEESLEVFPLYNNGELYGAIQVGIHSFYALEADKPEYLTSTAKFTHLWLLQNGCWKLHRGLSYDHQLPSTKE